MNSPCIGEVSHPCFYGCCPNPFLCLPESTHTPNIPSSRGSVAASRHDFAVATASTLNPFVQFSNHESLPSLEETFSNFTKAYPHYPHTNQADQIRAKEYYHLSLSNHVCLDYVGHCLFSYTQQKSDHSLTASVLASSSSSPQYSAALEKSPFFDISYKSVNLYSQILYGGQESDLESRIRKRIMGFMNISESDYSMVFTANQSSAFKLLADSYPFQSNQNLLTVYDYESEAVEVMIESSKKRGVRAMSAEFSWPNLRIQSGNLRKKLMSKRKRRGLFVFPLQSRMTGGRYSYQWMSMAQENGWHVLLDACALGAKDMDTLGLSLFKPDFLICSFYKVFGENPSGLGCLFVKNSSAAVIKDSTIATSIGIVSILPAWRPSEFPQESAFDDTKSEAPSSFSGPLSIDRQRDDETEDISVKSVKRKSQSFSEIEELEKEFESTQLKTSGSKIDGKSELECRGLDNADSVGLILISIRSRCLINWLVNALMSLQHPHSENGHPLVQIYGPKINFDRGPAISFNVFDWKGEKVDPALVQKLADRNHVSLSCGFLHHIWFSDKYEEVKESILEKRTDDEVLQNKRCRFGISVVTAALGFLTSFEDVYRVWVFVSRFLDADFVEKERWRYKALNQKTIEI